MCRILHHTFGFSWKLQSCLFLLWCKTKFLGIAWALVVPRSRFLVLNAHICRDERSAKFESRTSSNQTVILTLRIDFKKPWSSFPIPPKKAWVCVSSIVCNWNLGWYRASSKNVLVPQALWWSEIQTTGAIIPNETQGEGGTRIERKNHRAVFRASWYMRNKPTEKPPRYAQMNAFWWQFG